MTIDTKPNLMEYLEQDIDEDQQPYFNHEKKKRKPNSLFSNSSSSDDLHRVSIKQMMESK